MAIWAYLRHYVNLRILYSLSPIAIPYLPLPNNEFATIGAFELDWAAQQYKCWISQIISFVLLAALQAVNAFWFFLIIRILVRIVWKGVIKDERSDDEEEDEEEEGEVEGKKVEGLEEEKRMNGTEVASGQAKGPQVVLNGKPMVEEVDVVGRPVGTTGRENGNANGNGNGAKSKSRRKR